MKQKHEIRKHLHLQLVELWKQHPDLRSQAASFFFKSDRGDGIEHVIAAPSHVPTASNVKTWVQHIAEDLFGAVTTLCRLSVSLAAYFTYFPARYAQEIMHIYYAQSKANKFGPRSFVQNL